MKIVKSLSIAIAVLSTAVSAQANNPVVDAECAAIFRGMSINLERSSPDLSARARNVGLRLKARADSVIGVSTATRYYTMKMDDMTLDLRTNGGTGIRENEMKFCVGLARSSGLM